MQITNKDRFLLRTDNFVKGVNRNGCLCARVNAKKLSAFVRPVWLRPFSATPTFRLNESKYNPFGVFWRLQSTPIATTFSDDLVTPPFEAEDFHAFRRLIDLKMMPMVP